MSNNEKKKVRKMDIQLKLREMILEQTGCQKTLPSIKAKIAELYRQFLKADEEYNDLIMSESSESFESETFKTKIMSICRYYFLVRDIWASRKQNSDQIEHPRTADKTNSPDSTQTQKTNDTPPRLESDMEPEKEGDITNQSSELRLVLQALQDFQNEMHCSLNKISADLDKLFSEKMIK